MTFIFGKKPTTESCRIPCREKQTIESFLGILIKQQSKKSVFRTELFIVVINITTHGEE